MKKMTRLQKGLSGYELLFVLIAAGFVMTCIFSLGPHYLDDMSVASSLTSVHRDLSSKKTSEMNNVSIVGALQKNLQVNGVNDEILKSIKVKRDTGSILVSIDYEIRQHMFGNVDVLLVFKHQEDFAAPPPAQ